ncbi:hypothetical protein BHS06_01640 [Myxococcus xanthus]|nr:hypothetical protein BHS06_01640 [Myxococcus xanthus]
MGQDDAAHDGESQADAAPALVLRAHRGALQRLEDARLPLQGNRRARAASVSGRSVTSCMAPTACVALSCASRMMWQRSAT